MMVSKRRGFVGLEALVVVAFMSVGAEPSSGAAGPGPPLDLRCEYTPNPLGLGEKAPRLSWEVNDRRRGAVQSAYQILVTADDPDSAGDDKKTVWDSGKVESGQSVHVVYAGKPLDSGRRYFWKVRTWDEAGSASSYSEPAWWEMSLLGSDEWSARWITAPALSRDDEPALRGQWIWHPTEKGENTSVYFRAAFDVPDDATVAGALIRATADDRCVVYVNGANMGQGRGFDVMRGYDVTSEVRPGRNVVAIEGANAKGPCGLLFSMRVRFDDGEPLELHSGAHWLVSVKAHEGWREAAYDDSAWDKAAVVGGYGDPPWGEPRLARQAPRSICMRKDITLKGAVARARAYVSGLGCYRMSINGQRVGGDVFTPGWTHYPKRVQYQTYDVTGVLREGANALGAMLGNAWWSGGLGWNQAATYGEGNLRFILQLNVEYEDGTHESFVTDDTWKAHPSPVTRDSFYNGETYDARLEMPGWDKPSFADKDWTATVIADDQPAEHLVPQRCETIRVTEEKSAVAVTRPEPETYIFDFGQNLVGWTRLTVRGPRGTRIKVRFAEVLKNDGTIYRDNYRAALATDEYILKGHGEEVWEPRFTYRGFRYAEVTGWPGWPARDALVARVVHTDAPFAGSFSCSNELINRIYRNTLWGQRSNMHSVPTDCPQRDERLGWMGDAQIFAPTACWNMDMARFFAKWMTDIIDSQGADGHVTDVAPVTVVSGPAAPGWGDAVAVIPWTLHQFYGDRRVIEENYDGIKRWVEYMRGHAPKDLYEPTHGFKNYGYGDWVAVVESPKEPIATAYYYYSTMLLSRMADVVGNGDDAAEYAALARRIAKAFNDEFLDTETNQYLGGTQTANILPLWFGITPADRQAAVLANLVRDIEKRDDHLSTGFLGTGYLMPLLTSRGHHDVAYRLATQRTYPSWGYMVEQGATTIWERWNTNQIDKVDPGMNSFNHFCFGAVAQWFYEALGGINIDQEHPGFKEFVIHPRPVDGLDWARCEYPSMYGRIRSAWWRQDGKVVLQMTVPPNTSATVHVPTLGTPGATITEGGTTVAQAGKAGEQVPGVRFLRSEPEAVLFEVGAGCYRFVVDVQ